MALTPNTSFSSDDLYHRGRSIKYRPRALSNLPSPQASDSNGSDTGDALEASTDDGEIEQAYQAIWEIFCGRPGSEPIPASNPEFRFQQGQRSYERLYQRLDEHKGLLAYFEDQVRKDWDARTGVLRLRIMPARPLHDIFQNTLLLAIERELDLVAESTPALQPFRKKLCPGGNAAIEKRHTRSRPPEFEKSPDGQWLWAGSRYPPFVFEVAYSQEEESLVDKVCLEGLGPDGAGYEVTVWTRRDMRGAEPGRLIAHHGLWTLRREEALRSSSSSLILRSSKCPGGPGGPAFALWDIRACGMQNPVPTTNCFIGRSPSSSSSCRIAFATSSASTSSTQRGPTARQATSTLRRYHFGFPNPGKMSFR